MSHLDCKRCVFSVKRKKDFQMKDNKERLCNLLLLLQELQMTALCRYIYNYRFEIHILKLKLMMLVM